MQLVKWVEANAPAKELLWRDSFFQQTNFVGGLLAWCLTPNWLLKKYDRLANRVEVVSAHTSKSVLLPVYSIVTDNGYGGEYFSLVFRNNFYNWNVSVEADSPLTAALDFYDLGVVSDDQGYCYCEGMENWRYGSRKDDAKRFTCSFANDHDFYVFARALRHHYGLGRNSEDEVEEL
jgi:hypothetical protein